MNQMKLVIVGTGYVGLVSGACFAEFGYNTVCVDSDNSIVEKLNLGKCPFYEPGMDDLLSKHLNNTKLLSFSSSLKDSIKDADLIFITVGTPTRRLEDEADLSYVWNVAEEISQYIEKYVVIITKSTVPVGTCKQVKNIISKKISKDNFDLVSNPEFLREGSAINDFMRPDRVIIGTENTKSEKIMKELYRPLYLKETPIVSTTIETAEIIKYASNSFLATKIGFINEIADLCEVVGANVQEVSKAMGIDQRIGPKFLNAGPGYGGSCFPKDVKAFVSTAKKFNIDLSIIDAVNRSNELRIKKIGNKIIKNTPQASIVSFLGLSFKPNTDDIRESTSIKLANFLFEHGYQIQCFDPVAINNAKKEFPGFNYFTNAYAACKNADAIIIATEWNDFRALNFIKIGKLVKTKKIFDLRNIYNSLELEKIGYKYYGTGK